jgi:hypothetical protein
VKSLVFRPSPGTFSRRPPTPPGCGRDDRTPPAQKFNFEVRVKAQPLQWFETFAFFFLVVSMIFKFCIASYSQAY